MKCISHSTKKRTNPKTAIPSRARSSSAIPRPGPLRPPPRTALPPGNRVGARRGGAGGERKVGRGRGGVGWGRKGRAGPARPRPRAVLGALATAGAAVAGLGGLGGRGSAFGLASPHLCGRQPDFERPRPRRPTTSLRGSAPRSSAPCSAAAAPRTNRNRRLAPRVPGAPRPCRSPPSATAASAPLRGGARRSSPPTLPPSRPLRHRRAPLGSFACWTPAGC